MNNKMRATKLVEGEEKDTSTTTQGDTVLGNTPPTPPAGSVTGTQQDVKNCARCGQDHIALRFAKLSKPGEDFTHWAACPGNGEPIMMKVE